MPTRSPALAMRPVPTLRSSMVTPFSTRTLGAFLAACFLPSVGTGEPVGPCSRFLANWTFFSLLGVSFSAETALPSLFLSFLACFLLSLDSSPLLSWAISSSRPSASAARLFLPFLAATSLGASSSSSVSISSTRPAPSMLSSSSSDSSPTRSSSSGGRSYSSSSESTSESSLSSRRSSSWTT